MLRSVCFVLVSEKMAISNKVIQSAVAYYDVEIEKRTMAVLTNDQFFVW